MIVSFPFSFIKASIERRKKKVKRRERIERMKVSEDPFPIRSEWGRKRKVIVLQPIQFLN